jgi:hypothetical protein
LQLQRLLQLTISRKQSHDEKRTAQQRHAADRLAPAADAERWAETTNHVSALVKNLNGPAAACQRKHNLKRRGCLLAAKTYGQEIFSAAAIGPLTRFVLVGCVAAGITTGRRRCDRPDTPVRRMGHEAALCARAR